jgi:D-alanyl-D-alanine carboxypeptidase
MTSTLHASAMDAANFSYKAPWQENPILSVEPVPERIGELTMPELTAESVIAIDLASGKILYEKNSDLQRPIGSLTKIMTALIVAEEETPYTVVEVSPDAVTKEGSIVWLNAGEKITVKDLMYGMMIASGNDAALALAIYNGGSIDHFVKKMNQKAARLDLQNTHFSNPMGFDGDNYSTARDVAMLTMIALKNDFLTEPTDLAEYNIQSVSGITHELLTTNELLKEKNAVDGWTIQGFKTGKTPEAGECVIALAIHGSPEAKPGDIVPEKSRVAGSMENQILTVVLGSAERFEDTRKLLEWINVSYEW